jgi:predicted GIY-YIG superfamily endonuclease
MKKICYVYFIQRGYGAIKIGVSYNPEERCRHLQTADYKILHVIAKFPMPSRQTAFDMEKELHEKFSNYRLTNGEWFKRGIINEFQNRAALLPYMFDNEGNKIPRYGPDKLNQDLEYHRKEKQRIRRCGKGKIT